MINSAVSIFSINHLGKAWFLWTALEMCVFGTKLAWVISADAFSNHKKDASFLDWADLSTSLFLHDANKAAASDLFNTEDVSPEYLSRTCWILWRIAAYPS